MSIPPPPLRINASICNRVGCQVIFLKAATPPLVVPPSWPLKSGFTTPKPFLAAQYGKRYPHWGGFTDSKALAVIAGVGPGLGKSLAFKFASEYKVVLLSRTQEKLDKFAEEIKKEGGDVWQLRVVELIRGHRNFHGH